MGLFNWFTQEIAIDLGTANTLIIHNDEVVVNEPSIIALNRNNPKEVEKRAVRDSAEQAGAKEVYLIHEPMAAALGIGIDVEEPVGNMIIDIGGGTTGITVLPLPVLFVTRVSGLPVMNLQLILWKLYAVITAY